MRLRHLVVVVPGIAGSRLESERGPAWEVRLGSVASSVLRPAALSLNEQLYPAGPTPTGTLPWLGRVHSLGRLTKNIGDRFPGTVVDVCHYQQARNPRADVVVFSYDFRRSVRQTAERLAAEIDARLAGLGADARAGRVVVVAHSMGGLVARYWLGPLGGWKVCRALVTLGTPHRGAPKALDWLVNGPPVLRTVRRELADEARAVLAEWDSMYELLPRYPAIRDVTEDTERDPGTAEPRLLYPYELPGLGGRARAAFAVHEEIERGWAEIPPQRVPEVVPVFTRGHATFTHAELDDTQLTLSKSDAGWLPNPGWKGDSTVPAISAIPVELSELKAGWTADTRRHLALPSTPLVAAKLLDFTGDSLASVRGTDTPDEPWIGLDLDDLHPAGEPLTVQASLEGIPESAAASLFARITSSDGLLGPRLRMEADGDAWTITLPPGPAGSYEVEVRAVIPGRNDVVCTDTIGLVAP